MEENWLNDEYVAYYNANYSAPSEEFADYMQILDLNKDDTVMDFGCGNGEFIRSALKYVNTAYGLDISGLQIKLASEKLPQLSREQLICSSFTEYCPQQELFTKGFSRKALHHLTDIEKEIFAANIGPAFKKGALLYIEDGIFFEFEREALEKNWQKLIKDAENYYGASWPKKEHDILNSFTAEYPCGIEHWRRCLKKAGFEIIKTMPKCSFYGGILAKKND